MAVQRCLNCVYCIVEPLEWLHSFWRGEYPWPQCANNPYWPGQLHDVSGIACCNYRPRPVLPTGDTVRLIPLGDGFYAYVDKADYEWLSQYHWHLQNGYAARREKNKVILMHRDIMQPSKGMVVDHIDNNKANNCRFNLRVCTPAENRRNNRKRNDARSRFKGVSYHKRMRKWRARCWCKGWDPFVGYFEIDVEAARAYDHAAVERFGEYARLNFPEEWPPQRRAEVCALHQAEGIAPKRKRKKAKPKKKNSDVKRTTKRDQGDKTKGKRRKVRGKSKEPRGQIPKRKTQSARRQTKPKRATSHRSRVTAPKGPTSRRQR